MCENHRSIQDADKGNKNIGLHSTANLPTNNKQKSSIPLSIGAYIPDDNPNTLGDHDVSIPNKKFDFLNHALRLCSRQGASPH